MAMLTIDELKFLAGLKTRWRALYHNELARLLRAHDGCAHRRLSPAPPTGSTIRQVVPLMPQRTSGHLNDGKQR